MSETSEQPWVEPEKKPERRWLLPTLVGVGAILLGVGVGAAGDEGSDPVTAGDTSAGQQTDAAVVDEPSPEPSPDATFHQPVPEDFALTVKTLEKQCFR